MDVVELLEWFTDLENHLSETQGIIAAEIIKEVRSRLQFLVNVGLTYLALDRSSKSLSGG
jgi:Excinuclease ATPase subunit